MKIDQSAENTFILKLNWFRISDQLGIADIGLKYFNVNCLQDIIGLMGMLVIVTFRQVAAEEAE